MDDQGSGGALFVDGSAASDCGQAEPTVKPALAVAENSTNRLVGLERIDQQFSQFHGDSPPCEVCGAITVPNGNCYKCYNCGSTSGCS